MKRFLFIAPFILGLLVFARLYIAPDWQKAVYGDTVTSGSVGLLLPTTGQVDTTRSWADKYNENFRIIASSLSSVSDSVSGIVVFSSSIGNGQVYGQDIAQGTIGSSQTIPGQFVLIGTDVIKVSSMTNLLYSSFTWTGSQVFSSSITFSSPTISIGGNQFIFQSSAPDTGDKVFHYLNGRVYLGDDANSGAGGGGGAVVNSTDTKDINIGGGLYLSTTGICNIPNGCFRAGNSTWNVVGVEAMLGKGSTVTITRFDFVYSSGGANNVQRSNRLWSVDVPTALSVGYAATSVLVSTGMTLPAGSILSVDISSMAPSGLVSESATIRLHLWKKQHGQQN